MCVGECECVSVAEVQQGWEDWAYARVTGQEWDRA